MASFAGFSALPIELRLEIFSYLFDGAYVKCPADLQNPSWYKNVLLVSRRWNTDARDALIKSTPTITFILPHPLSIVLFLTTLKQVPVTSVRHISVSYFHVPLQIKGRNRAPIIGLMLRMIPTLQLDTLTFILTDLLPENVPEDAPAIMEATVTTMVLRYELRDLAGGPAAWRQLRLFGHPERSHLAQMYSQYVSRAENGRETDAAYRWVRPEEVECVQATFPVNERRLAKFKIHGWAVIATMKEDVAPEKEPPGHLGIDDISSLSLGHRRWADELVAREFRRLLSTEEWSWDRILKERCKWENSYHDWSRSWDKSDELQDQPSEQGQETGIQPAHVSSGSSRTRLGMIAHRCRRLFPVRKGKAGKT